MYLKFNKQNFILHILKILKLHNMNEHMFKMSQSGFKLSIGYLMTQDTFRLVSKLF